MMTRRHLHEEVFPASAERLFPLLITPSAVRRWWGAQHVVIVARPGGIWVASWGDREDEPDYVTAARIREIEPPHRLSLFRFAYAARGVAPRPCEVDLSATFTLFPEQDGTALRVVQDGFPFAPDVDEFYAACGRSWLRVFAGIRQLLGAAH
jgi:uncharacterized protein YndB with AHSA1/START domain